MLTGIFLFAVKYEDQIDFAKMSAFLNANPFQSLFDRFACIAEKNLGLVLPDAIKCWDMITADNLLDNIVSGGTCGIFDEARSDSMIFIDRAMSDISSGSKKRSVISAIPTA